MLTLASVVDVRLWNKPNHEDEELREQVSILNRQWDFSSAYTSENELSSNQGSPFCWLMNSDELSSNRTDELSKGQTELVCSNHYSSNLERCELGDVGDEDRLRKSNSKTDKDSSAEPALPVRSCNLCNRTAEENNDRAA